MSWSLPRRRRRAPTSSSTSSPTPRPTTTTTSSTSMASWPIVKGWRLSATPSDGTREEPSKPEPDPKPEDYKPEWETYTELETLNSMVPIWKKQKSEVTDEEYASFYKDKFNDYADPARVIVSRTEGHPRTTTPCSSCPATAPTTSTPRTTRRVWPSTPPASSSWRSAATCCPTTSSFVKGIVDQSGSGLNISPRDAAEGQPAQAHPQRTGKKIKNQATPCWPTTAKNARLLEGSLAVS